MISTLIVRIPHLGDAPQNPKNPKPQTPNPRSKTLVLVADQCESNISVCKPKPQTPNSKPQTPNPKHYILDPDRTNWRDLHAKTPNPKL